MHRHLLLLSALALAAFLACSRDENALEPVVLSCMAPAFLKPGDKVALLSPSSFTPMENVVSGVAILQEWGLQPVVGPNVGKTYKGSYAGTPEERLADLRWALEDPSIKAILCNRGGYGTIGLVDKLPLEVLSAHPKWLVGFSDITTLHGMETRAGVMSIHGTMCSLMAKYEGKDISSLLLRDLLMGDVPAYELPAHPQSIPGKASGILAGGNLCTFSPVLGTPADATLGRDIILFIEEVEENMSHIDRLINLLIFNGVMDRCKGVVLGQFTDCEANLDFGSVEEMIASYLKPYGVPVLAGFPGGHGEVNLPLVMGAPVTLDVRSDGATLCFGLEGTAQSTIVTAEIPETVTANADEEREAKASRLLRLYNFVKHYSGARK